MEKTRSQMLAVPAQFSDIEEPQALLERLREAEDLRRWKRRPYGL